MLFNAFITFIYITCLVITVTYSLTFINEEYSHVILKRETWHPDAHVKFRFLSNIDDGTILTATNQNNNELKLHLDKLKFKVNLEGEDYDVRGLSGMPLVDKHTWVDIELKQVGKVVYMMVGEYMGAMQLSRRRDWLLGNWTNITLGANLNGSTPHWKSFIGCIEFPPTHVTNGSADHVEESLFVLDDCVDACAFMTCQNGGKCLNNYKNIKCDCRASGYEGEFCEEKCVAINFEESSYLNYIGNVEKSDAVNDADEKTEHSVRFKTRHQDGIFFLANHSNEMIILELFHGRMILTLTYHSVTTRLFIGRTVDDGLWHHALITRFKRQVKLTLDDEYSSTNAVNNYQKESREIILSVGGIDEYSHLLTSSFSRRNFQGCLQSVYLNKLNILNNVDRNTITSECDVT